MPPCRITGREAYSTDRLQGRQSRSTNFNKHREGIRLLADLSCWLQPTHFYQAVH